MKTRKTTQTPQPIVAVLVTTLAFALVGCGRQANPSSASSASASAPSSSAPTAEAPLAQILVSWQQGDKEAAVRRLMETDWKSGPVFAAGSPLNHREDELPGMTQAARDPLMREVLVQLGELKSLAAEVRSRGRAAVSADPALARRHFAKLDELGAALDQPGGLKIVQMVGQAFRKMAAAESAGLGK